MAHCYGAAVTLAAFRQAEPRIVTVTLCKVEQIPEAGALEVDAEDITGGESAVLSYDPRGLPDAVVAAHPELAGQLALRVDRDTSRRLPGIASGDVAVGVYSGGRLVDAGLVDTSAVG